MTQISRPFQIALVALGLFAAVWFIALRGQSATPTGSGSSASAPSSTAQAGRGATAGGSSSSSSLAATEEKGAAAPTPIYHGAAPGLGGLTRAIAKAHEAVASSQQSAKQLEGKSAPAPTGSSAAGSGTSTAPKTATAPTLATSSAGAHRAATHAAGASGVTPAASSTTHSRPTKASPPAMQATVEGELKQHKVVTILFWTPRSSVDESVHRELQVVGGALGGKVAVHNARAVQVGSFGSITRAVQVDQTPTILIVNPQGQTTTLTGLQDVFSIEQAIDEARRS